MHPCIKKRVDSAHAPGPCSWIARQCQINDGRGRKGKDGIENVPVDGRRVLQGAVGEQTSPWCNLTCGAVRISPSW